MRQALALGVPREEIFFTTKIFPDDFSFELHTISKFYAYFISIFYYVIVCYYITITRNHKT